MVNTELKTTGERNPIIKKQRGGKRAGAGRKSLQVKLNGYTQLGSVRHSTEAKVIGVRIPNHLLSQFIKDNGGSAFLRDLFFQYCNSKEGNAKITNYIRNSTADKHAKNQALNLLTETKRLIKEKKKKQA